MQVGRADGQTEEKTRNILKPAPPGPPDALDRTDVGAQKRCMTRGEFMSISVNELL